MGPSGGNFLACMEVQCTLGVHRSALKMDIPGKSFVIEAPVASRATKIRCFNQPFLKLSGFPTMFTKEGSTDILFDLKTTPMVWKALFLTYPGREAMLRIMTAGVDAHYTYEGRGLLQG